jgi:hypothetical protein
MNRSYDDNPDDGVVRDFFGFSDSYRFNSDLETPQWQRFNNRVFAPGFKSAVINERLSPSLSCAFPSDSSEYYFYYPFNSDDTYNNQQFLEGQNNWPNIPQAWGFDIQMRIKGDAGIDTNNDGVVDNTQYPTGYYPFYAFKYEVSEQQYADFFNCLTSSQRVSLGLAGSSIAESNGQYYAAYPNRSCRNANPLRLAAYADFTGLRPMTYLELHKAFNGNSTASRAVKGIKISNFYYDFLLNNDLWVFDDYFETNDAYGAGVFGCVDLVGNNYEPYVSMSSNTFTPVNGDGVIGTDINNVSWPLQDVFWGEPLPHPAQIQGVVNDYFFELRFFNSGKPYESFGFRLCRSAE